jgi:DNA-binding transcriptional MerR regulator
VRTIRFYSDSGVVPATFRSPAGYRPYDLHALARLDLVRTLRDLGVDLATIRRVLEREISLPEVAAAHAQALDAQIRTLRLRRAVLRAVASRGSSPEELELMHKLARLSDEERHRIICDFIDEAFGGLDANPEFVAMMRSAMPDLPDDPAFGHPDTPAYRRKLLTRLETAGDPRAERYWQLLAVINGWPVPPTLAPAFDWFIRALQHDTAQ